MWTLKEGVDLVFKIEYTCRRFGYFPCLYGSVLYKGQSNDDIDLQIISFTGVDNSEILVQKICKILMAKIVGDRYDGFLNTKNFLLHTDDEKVIDLVIRTDKISA